MFIEVIENILCIVAIVSPRVERILVFSIITLYTYKTSSSKVIIK